MLLEQDVLEQILLLLQEDQVTVLRKVNGTVHQPSELLSNDPASEAASNHLLSFSQLDPAAPLGNKARQTFSESLPHLVVLFLFVGHGELQLPNRLKVIQKVLLLLHAGKHTSSVLLYNDDGTGHLRFKLKGDFCDASLLQGFLDESKRVV